MEKYENCESIIIVNNIKGTKAKLAMYKKEKQNWKKIITADALIGQNGASLCKKEGDKKTPIGVFKLRHSIWNT